ncbi:hypothetical protein Goarm_021092 [Gossypium armourianum]|uniref:Uncharacterized protein n=1 Tax=Gossypium armourianum TaxID=34283 RepID=A0A7J9IQJ8_9ROSI|nr:hypothetical protein [Gossypium armourianum]
MAIYSVMVRVMGRALM